MIEIQPHATEHSYEGSQLVKSMMNMHVVWPDKKLVRLCFHHFICGFWGFHLPKSSMGVTWQIYSFGMRIFNGTGNLVSLVFRGDQGFGIHIWCVYREGRGTEVWRSCLGRQTGRLRPAKWKGQPKVSSSLNQPHASLGPNGTRKDNLKISPSLLHVYVQWVRVIWSITINKNLF